MRFFLVGSFIGVQYGKMVLMKESTRERAYRYEQSNEDWKEDSYRFGSADVNSAQNGKACGATCKDALLALARVGCSASPGKGLNPSATDSGAR